MKQKFTVLFDLDGTLVDTAPDLMLAHNHVMKKFGYPTKSLEDLKSQYGCMVAGYEESGKKIAEIGRKEVNKHDIYIKFECYPYKIYLPKNQPKLES